MLLAAGAVIALPIFRGGHTTYLDNPVHLAEVYSLAGEGHSGWSDIAFCGFPLGDLHSPVWFGLLTRWTRAGLAPEPLYAAFSWFGFCLPAVAFYFLARRRTGPAPAAVLSFLLLVQRPAVAGISSAFGGMWTFYIAAAAFLLLADRLARPNRSRRDLAWIAALAAAVGLTHLFVAIAVFYLVLVHAAFARRSLRRLALDGAALLLGAAASAVYWLPSLLARAALHFFHWDLPPGQALACLVLPVDMNAMLLGRGFVSGALGYTDALPMVAIGVAGIAGAVRLRRRESRDPLAVYGVSLAAVLLVLLLGVIPLTRLPLLGAVSWRHLYTVRLGLALAALPLLRSGGFTLRAPLAAVLAALAVASAFWWGTPLRAETPASGSAEMADVRSLWSWLERNSGSIHGRVYLQDTFLAEPMNARLSQSHVLTLTAHEARVRQLGAYYRLMPYPTSLWTKSDQGTLFGLRIASADELEPVVRRLRLTGCTHLVLSEARLTAVVASRPEAFTERFRAGRFSVWELAGPSEVSFPASDSVRVRTESYRTGEITVRAEVMAPGTSVMVAESYHPSWKLSESPGARITPTKQGLMLIENLAPGANRLVLRYSEPHLPLWITLASWLAIGALAYRRNNAT